MKNSVNMKLAVKKGISNVSSYLDLEEKYQALFYDFLFRSLSLKEYDQQLLNSELDFVSSSHIQKNLNLQYIELLNFFFIEKLDENDLAFLKSTTLGKYLDAEQIDFISRTYKEVIRDNYFHNQYQDAVYKVSYDNVSSEQFANIFYFANNDALVFRILYSQNSKKYSDTDFVKNLHEKKNFLEDIKRQIINEVKEKLQMECYVFEEKRFD